MRSCPFFLGCLPILVATVFPVVARADAPPEGVVLCIDAQDGAAALAAARRAGGARWRVETIESPTPAPPVAPPDAPAEDLRAAYLEADFLRCLARLSDPALDSDALLEAGHRDAAASVGLFGAACAFGAGDVELARGMFARLQIGELDTTEDLAVTSPDFQALAEQVRSEVVELTRIRLNVRTRPARAQVIIDGGSHRCEATPCTVTLLPGQHVVQITRLGHAQRVLREVFEVDARRTLSLDPAPAGTVRQQLAEVLARPGGNPGAIDVARAAAAAFGARVVTVAFHDTDRSRAVVYDRARDRLVSQVAVSGGDGVARAVDSAIAEWRGATEPTPLLAEPLFWVGTIGAAVAAGITVFLLVRPGEVRNDIVFRR